MSSFTCSVQRLEIMQPTTISHLHDSHHCYCSMIIVRSCFGGRLSGVMKVRVVSLIKKLGCCALGAVSLSSSFPVWLVCSQTGPVWLCPRLSVYLWVKVWCSLHSNKGKMNEFSLEWNWMYCTGRTVLYTLKTKRMLVLNSGAFCFCCAHFLI